ncbi:LEAF RUST 10 DISEASE-RESISTANCE LOCUS RECEPTOR-LIKE PROTEIN KINASE-like [Olea europaea subsp. europaea]|uniref:LEAF RUST 10 DISEASE-RESISTANCE LOCUS RECEPTOR-LIKE PROTEIN KINASE-like n=1 Tax=Olea europaea subsp. europaea TaxID=158383 RepID=A0A8S0PP20_OLEEU|nr:LEAF RUST 10 DISEASE-RESISTANCE LOCUS RECEPTOR-LIKE PROTEIN KINASE-like [Olea europaea subsp. europaea]
MPPSPSSTISAAAALLLAFFITLAYCCPPPPPKAAKVSCPPFKSTPPFPFSSSSGCGHPFFQIQCSSSRATMSINNISFYLLQYEPKSTSLTLSPTPSQLHHHNCSSSLPISVSGSPFRVSDSSCSRLSALEPCLPPNLPNCSHCSRECNLIKNLPQLLQDCNSSTRHREDFQPECQGDVLGNILREGFEVEWDEDRDFYFSSCKSCRASNGFCGFNSTDPMKQFICFPSQSRNGIALLSIIFLFACFLIAISVGIVFFRSRRKALMAAEEDPAIIFLRHYRSAGILPPVFTYEELEYSTNWFDPKRKIGDGGFGSVYLGLLYNGRIVAVKHLHKRNDTTAAGAKGFSTKSFCNEILILSSIYHPNLVKLHGYCSDPRGLVLVYDYVPNGTLSDHLHGKKSLYLKGALNWNTRVDIALQIAMAIEYLHFSVVPPVVHRDITSSNVFVEKDMRVRVGDFGLSRLLVCSETSMASSNSSEGVRTGPQGTPGYVDPDYYRSFRLNEKSDIYSFGVVLLELITGMRAVDQNRDKAEMALADMVVPRIQMGLLHQVVDPVLVEDGDAVEGVCAVAELAFRCVAADKDDRPDAREVAAELRRIKGRGIGDGGC